MENEYEHACQNVRMYRRYGYLEHIGLKDELRIVGGQTRKDHKCKQRCS